MSVPVLLYGFSVVTGCQKGRAPGKDKGEGQSSWRSDSGGTQAPAITFGDKLYRYSPH